MRGVEARVDPVGQALDVPHAHAQARGQRGLAERRVGEGAGQVRRVARGSVDGSSITTSALALSGIRTVSRAGDGRRHGDSAERGVRAAAPRTRAASRGRPGSCRRRRRRRRRVAACPRRSAAGRTPTSSSRVSASTRRSAPPRCADGTGGPGDRCAARPSSYARTPVWSCCWRIEPTMRFFSFSSSSAGKTGVRRISTSRSSSISTSRERAEPADVHADRIGGVGGKRQGRAAALELFRDLELRAPLRPLGELPRGHRGEEPPVRAERREGRAWSEPEIATVGLKWFSRTSSSAPFSSTRRRTASSKGTRPGERRRSAGGDGHRPLSRSGASCLRGPAAGGSSPCSGLGRKSPTVRSSSRSRTARRGGRRPA